MALIAPKRFSPIQKAAPQPKGRAPTYMWATAGRGVPRSDDILRVRLLEDTSVIALPLDIITTQLASADWSVQPAEGFEESAQHIKAAEEITEFLDGHYNENEESWTTLQEAWARDIVSIGSGVIEKVLDNKRNVTALYVRDGGLYTKNPDENGILPTPDTGQTAYWEWGGAMAYGAFFREQDSQYIFEYEAHKSPFIYRYNGAEPTPFLRDELIWSDYNKRTWDIYGKGKVAAVKILAEVILNMILINRDDFSSNEIPEGILDIVGVDAAGLQDFRDYWEAEVKGEAHKLPIVASPQGSSWTPFRSSRKELQYLESQKWFMKLVWMTFGLNANEVGDIAEVTRPGGSKQFSVDVWRKTTMPLLDLMQQDINRQLLPSMEPFKRVGGNIVFKYKIAHPDADDQMRLRQRDDLNASMMTVNQALEERGTEPVPWGDMPLKLAETMMNVHPEWFYENFVSMENKPEAPEPTNNTGLFGLSYNQKKTSDLREFVI